MNTHHVEGGWIRLFKVGAGEKDLCRRGRPGAVRRILLWQRGRVGGS